MCPSVSQCVPVCLTRRPRHTGLSPPSHRQSQADQVKANMGNSLTKSTDNQHDQLQANGQAEGLSKTSTLPASFRRRANNIGNTGSLPRNSGGVDNNFDRTSSFGQRLRKSCRNWAKQRGLVSNNKNKENGKNPSEKNIKDGAKTGETSHLTSPAVENTSVEPETKQDSDIGSIVASLVVEAHKKKMASRAQSRAQSREMLQLETEAPLNKHPEDAEKAEVSEVSEVGEGDTKEKDDIVEEGDKLVVSAEDNADKYDSDSQQTEQENENPRQDHHKECLDGEKNGREEEGILVATMEQTPNAKEQVASEHKTCPEERKEIQAEADNCNESETSELIDINGADKEILNESETETASNSPEEQNVPVTSEDSESTEKQMGQIISDIVENVTCDPEERETLTGKMER